MAKETGDISETKDQRTKGGHAVILDSADKPLFLKALF